MIINNFLLILMLASISLWSADPLFDSNQYNLNQPSNLIISREDIEKILENTIENKTNRRPRGSSDNLEKIKIWLSLDLSKDNHGLTLDEYTLNKNLNCLVRLLLGFCKSKLYFSASAANKDMIRPLFEGILLNILRIKSTYYQFKIHFETGGMFLKKCETDEDDSYRIMNQTLNNFYFKVIDFGVNAFIVYAPNQEFNLKESSYYPDFDSPSQTTYQALQPSISQVRDSSISQEEIKEEVLNLIDHAVKKDAQLNSDKLAKIISLCLLELSKDDSGSPLDENGLSNNLKYLEDLFVRLYTRLSLINKKQTDNIKIIFGGILDNIINIRSNHAFIISIPKISTNMTALINKYKKNQGLHKIVNEALEERNFESGPDENGNLVISYSPKYVDTSIDYQLSDFRDNNPIQSQTYNYHHPYIQEWYPNGTYLNPYEGNFIYDGSANNHDFNEAINAYYFTGGSSAQTFNSVENNPFIHYYYQNFNSSNLDNNQVHLQHDDDSNIATITHKRKSKRNEPRQTKKRKKQ